MFDIIGKYQVSIFLNASDIVPSPDIITSLLNIFKDKSFLPSTFQEIGLNSPAPQVRLRLNSPNNEWTLNFANRRIDIEKNPVATSGRNMGDIKGFIDDVIDFMERILSHFKKKGNRLSIITSGMLQEMSTEKLDCIYRTLFHPLPFYSNPVPFEWNYRAVTRRDIKIKSNAEQINVITYINRLKGQFMDSGGIMPFDRIEITFDINTLAEKDRDRFTVSSMKEFLEKAILFRDDIIKEIVGEVKNA